MDRQLEYRVLLAADIEQSAGRGNIALTRIREVLAASLRESVERGGIAWAGCLVDDLGDGIRIAAPPGTGKASLVHPLLHELDARLQAHNRTASASTRIRVRIALHAGEIMIASEGTAAGRPLEILARLLDSAPVRAGLRSAPESVTLAALMSQHFYEETVPHGYPGIDPHAFTPVRVSAKEYQADAWLYLPASVSMRQGRGDAVVPEPPSSGSMVNTTYDNSIIYAAQNGDQYIRVVGGR